MVGFTFTLGVLLTLTAVVLFAGASIVAGGDVGSSWADATGYLTGAAARLVLGSDSSRMPTAATNATPAGGDQTGSRASARVVGTGSISAGSSTVTGAA